MKFFREGGLKLPKRSFKRDILDEILYPFFWGGSFIAHYGNPYIV